MYFCRGDSIDLAVINPRREKSGVYKVILKNAQGQDERDIMVNIMGKISLFPRLVFYLGKYLLGYSLLSR